MAGQAEKTSTRIHYMLALVRSLLAHDRPLRPAEVYAWLEDRGERRRKLPRSGKDPDQHFRREVRFARQDLADGGVIARTKGVWQLLDAERAATLAPLDAQRIIRNNRLQREQRRADRAGRGDPPMSSYGRSQQTTGPRPGQWQATMVREEGPAVTYAFRFGTSDLWKIGFAARSEERLAQVNQHVPVELFNDRWMLELQVPWPSQELAYAMEQEVLGRLDDRRTMFERVRCSKKDLISAWNAAQGVTAALAPGAVG